MAESSKKRLTLGFCDRDWIEDYNGFWEASRVISITDPDARPAKIRMPEEHILRLAFHDLRPDQLELIDPESRKSIVLYTDVMAAMAVTFVKHHLVAMESLLIHCEAGVSRSPAMADVFRYALAREREIIWFPKRCAPNRHVHTLTYNAWQRLKTGERHDPAE